MKFIRRYWWKAALAAVALLCLLVLAGLTFPSYLLCVETRPTKADCIVVLGGDVETRALQAGQLYLARTAPKILVSGGGDCELGQNVLLAAGVPKEAVQTECESKDTMQNAEFSVKLLKAQGASRAIIVTSWFHSRRALACFRKAAPDIVFYSCPIVSDRQKGPWHDKYERRRVLREYAKIGWYWVRYGVSPI